MIPSSNLGGASRIVSLWRMKKVRVGLFLFSFFRFPSPIAHLRESFSTNLLACKNKRYGFSPYRLFCFLLLKQAGISTVQASFMYNETAATRKASIHDFFLANTMHDFLYSICGTKCERFSSVQVQAYPENCYISCKTKAAGLPPIPLDVYLFPTQTARLPHGVFSTRICASNRSASADNSNLANLSGKLLHPRKAKRQRFHPYRLMFIFCQRRQHGCHMAFSLLESMY